jgi:ABC-type multidrug transport system ATPase subunit
MLSVEEHLDIFCDFKGVDPSLKKEKIYKIMKDVDVYVHRNTLAKDLSGGNKRKLSVALALVADS